MVKMDGIDGREETRVMKEVTRARAKLGLREGRIWPAVKKSLASNVNLEKSLFCEIQFFTLQEFSNSD